MAEQEKRTCRVMVIGSSKPRLAKVMSLLLPLEQEPQQHEESSSSISVEYLPCVAAFDSYEDEHGKQIRYLTSVNYHGSHGAEKVGSSLAPFFDQESRENDNDEETKKKKSTRQSSYLGILGAAAGMGIEDSDDIDKLQTFFQTLRGRLPLKVVQPSPPFQSMKEETAAFRALSPEEKEEMALQQTMGPAKMAKFAHDYAHNDLIQAILDQERDEREQELQQERKRQEEALRIEEETRQQLLQAAQQAPIIMDETKPRYACRVCRTVLFAQADLETHDPSKHKFRQYTKKQQASSCQSYFLADGGCPWAGDMADVEGRLHCPKCQTKVGTWHWAGAQCSCGTWVSPAIQIPKSKVDTLNPLLGGDGGNNMLPPGTIISPFIAAAATVPPTTT